MDAGTAEAWLISFTTQLRAQLPAGNFIITHARTYHPVLEYDHAADLGRQPLLLGTDTVLELPVLNRQRPYRLQVHAEQVAWWRIPQGSPAGRQFDRLGKQMTFGKHNVKVTNQET